MLSLWSTIKALHHTHLLVPHVHMRTLPEFFSSHKEKYSNGHTCMSTHRSILNRIPPGLNIVESMIERWSEGGSSNGKSIVVR